MLAACAVVLVVQMVTFRISFKNDFLDYLNGQGADSMAKMLPRLTEAYNKHGNWEFLRNDGDAWPELMRPQGPFDEIIRNLSIADQTGAMLRTGLLDIHHQRVAGNLRVNADSTLLPIVADGRIVGWLAMVSFQQVMSLNDARFLEQQRNVWMLIGIASLAVIALLTFALTRVLLHRVSGLARATHRLAAGDYASRIQVGALDELGTLAQDFNRMAQALEHNERARRTFMADISHELRTPLAVIRAELEAIQDGIRPPSTRTFDAMHQEIKQLGKLIDDLHDLALTDIAALAYQRMPIDLMTVLQTALGSMQGRLDAKSLYLKTHLIEAPLIVNGDERRLQQLFTNLLENTLRYTNPGGEIQVSCTCGDTSVSIVFEDSTPGVSEDKLALLFERFYRVEASRNRTSGGSGLGLAICRNIAEAHDGHISAAASPLGGLRISIELALAPL